MCAHLGCGGNFTMINGNITSPNYPHNYESNTYCQWLLRTEPSHSILFKFSDFELENDCSADSVQIYDGSERRDDKLLLKSCGIHATSTTNSTNQTGQLGFTKPLKSSGNAMLIIMEADNGIEAKGFSAQYSTVYQTLIKCLTAEHLNDIFSDLNCSLVVRKSKPQQMEYWKLDKICVGQLMAVNGLSLLKTQVRKMHQEYKQYIQTISHFYFR